MQQIVVVGGGFAGLWAALAAVREIAASEAGVQVTLLSRDPWLVMRPRLYERDPAGLRQDLRPVLTAADVRFLEGSARDVDPAASRLVWDHRDGTAASLDFDRLVLATGSRMRRPPVPGLGDHGFDVDTFDGALRFDAHLASLAAVPADDARDGFVVLGGGFTGIELALELRDRLEAHLGPAAAERAVITIVDRAAEIGSELGPGPRPVILQALRHARVGLRLGRQVVEACADGVLLDDGSRLPARTVAMATGMVAAEPWPGVPGARDGAGRIVVTADLRVPEARNVFVAGDAAFAEAEPGHPALMSCQHALRMGRFAGYNAARDLMGLELVPYRQPDYVTCLDLGRSGAVLTRGWEREIALNGAEAKALKRRINGEVIYPPPADRATILRMAALDYRVR